MEMLERLRGKDDPKAYHYFLELAQQAAASDALYTYFDEFAGLVADKSSYVRTRGFRLCCAQAPWDTQNKLEVHLGRLLTMLEDDKPTAVRQCLAALHTVALYKPALSQQIEAKLRALDLSKYKDSMRPLIEKDIAALEAVL